MPGRSALAAALTLVCLILAISSASAMASWGSHKSFGEGHLNVPVGVAVDESSGDIFAGSYECSAPCPHVSAFDALGSFLSPPSPFGYNYDSGIAVDPANGTIFVVNAPFQEIEAFKPTGEPLSGNSIDASGSGNLEPFGSPETIVEIAADARGNVYLPNAPHNEIQVFNEKVNAKGEREKPVGVAETITGSGAHALKKPEGVAVGPAENLWVADTGDNRIEEFEPNGIFVTEITEDAAGVQAVAVDGSGDVFASIGGAKPHVVEYDAAGKALAGAQDIGEGMLSASPYGTLDGIAYDRAREYLYVVDGGGNLILRFADWGVATDLVGDVQEGAATLRGTLEVGAGSSVASCEFEYGPTTAYSKTAPCVPVGPYTTTTPVTAAVSGLGGDTHYRISAISDGGVGKVGEDEAFGPPAVGGGTAEAIVTTATLRTKIDPNGEPTRCEVQWVDAIEYAVAGYANAAAAPCAAEVGPEGTEDAGDGVAIAKLQANTMYHYRFVASNASGSATGSDQTFSTFGIAPESFVLATLGQAGELITQAGVHPYDVTDSFSLNTSTLRFANGTVDPLAPDANAKDVITELPPGLIGDPDAVPKCEPYDLLRNDCSGASQVGVIRVSTANPGHVSKTGRPEEKSANPIYNLVPPKGMAAQFGANIANFAVVHIDAKVRTGGDYGVTTEVLDSSADEGLVSAEVTLWGVPAAASHDEERYCPAPGKAREEAPCADSGAPASFLTSPTACTGEPDARMSVNSWQDPSVVVDAESKMPAITGCGEVPFTPSIGVTPESSVADSPTGLHVELTVPQQENPNKLAEADLEDATVTLPAGMTVNPSSVNGMVGCPLLKGREGHSGAPGIDLENGEGANCPAASKVGSVTIETPLLEKPLTGGVYIAEQNANPFGTVLALYVAAENAERGLVVKLAGKVSPDPKTGQLTITLDESPQLPFERVEFDFFGGERAVLASPPECGSYTMTSVLEPFSHDPAAGEVAGTPNATPSAGFKIDSRCADGFSPTLIAGMKENKAGAFSPFTTTLTREDGEQRLSTVSLKLPPGILGIIADVTLCPNAQAEAGDCPAASKLGHVVVQAGVGSEPITLPEAGKPEDLVYLTEKYDGAPFGLSIVVPAQAGPFNLGTVIIRSKVEIDPITGQVSVISDPLPSILQGIPVDVRAIHIEIDKPGFTFNPTNCEPMAVSGTIGSAEGATASVSTRFQAAGCRDLPFEPKFSAAIHAGHTKSDGEYLHATVQTAAGDANVAKVHVTLPGKLPARLETLKLACTEEQFAENPAGCPAGSFVGTAIARTPVLPVPLTGPAIFVSHGGAGFPNLDLVMQGDGVTVELVGDTYINSKSVTSSTFAGVPDVPVSQIDVVLPAGPHSALGGNGDMCSEPLYMPTTLTGQNGAVTTQKTKIAVEGCTPEVRVLGRTVQAGRAYIHLSVPFAGTLTASGSNVIGAREQVHAGRASVAVHLSPHAESLLSSYPGRRLRVLVHLRFVPRHGRALSTSVAVLMG